MTIIIALTQQWTLSLNSTRFAYSIGLIMRRRDMVKIVHSHTPTYVHYLLFFLLRTIPLAFLSVLQTSLVSLVIVSRPKISKSKAPPEHNLWWTGKRHSNVDDVMELQLAITLCFYGLQTRTEWQSASSSSIESAGDLPREVVRLLLFWMAVSFSVVVVKGEMNRSNHGLCDGWTPATPGKSQDGLRVLLVNGNIAVVINAVLIELTE